MAARKKGRKKRSRNKGFSGIPGTMTKQMSRKELGLAMLSFFGGTVLGSAIGKYSGLSGLAFAGAGVWKKNLYATSFGAGMFLSTVAKPAGSTTTESVQGLGEFSVDAMKENTMSYLKSLGSKLMLKAPASEGTNGLNGDEVTYFINPYTQQQEALDLRALDKIQEKVVQMQGTDMDFSERNF